MVTYGGFLYGRHLCVKLYCTSSSTTDPVCLATSRANSAYLDDDHDDAPLRLRTMDNVLGPATAPGHVTRALAQNLMLASEVKPSTIKEV